MDEAEERARFGDWRPQASQAARSPASAPVIVSAPDLMARTFAPISYVVPEIIAEGLTILAGRPKIGKSWLAYDIALSVAQGETCLGRLRCAQGAVLYLALEDNERRLQSRLRKLLIASDPPPISLHMATAWPRANEGGIEAIRSWIRNTPDARLVIVDVLQMFRPAASARDMPYEADYQAIKGLQSVASEERVAILVVHHTRKAGSDVDPFEKVSGTLGLSGAADTVAILDRDSQGATLYARGRDIQEVEKAVFFDKILCKWTIQGDAIDVRRTDERSSILDVLLSATEPMAPREIAIGADMPRNNVDQLLFKMARAGEVIRAGRGHYVHAERTDLMPLHKNDKKIRSGRDDES
nr:AAA family ATPase [Kaistia hirudinis]